MGAAIVAGFIIVLALMVTLAVIGLRYIAEANGHLKSVAETNNYKIQLATAMQTALRERALSMHALSILTDPFDKDEEIMRFDRYGAAYVDARHQFEQLAASGEETRILAHIRDLTREAQPEVQAVVNLSSRESTQQVFDKIRNSAMPMQREIADQVNALLVMQQKQTAAAVHAAENSYKHARDLMMLLSVIIFMTGLLIAAFVSRRVSRQAAQLANQAMFDTLTGLANRCLLQHRIEHHIALAQRNGLSFGVALMDLDRFKAVNDTLGHDVGDELLREVGRRLKDVVRNEDTVARLGGDEFVIVLPDINAQRAPKVAEKILAVLSRPFQWQEQSIDLGASLGISLYPSQCNDPSSLIRCADIAMYTAKRSGKPYAVYAPEQDLVTRSDLSFKSELQEAIESDQLCLHYQPKIDHAAQRVTGLEALIRWNHPSRGFLPPDSFIPAAEDAGVIGPLTEWVLKTSLARLAKLHAQGHGLTVSVNLSARSLHDSELPKVIDRLLSRHGVAPEYLTLEITETAVMANPSDGLRILTELDAMGIGLAIDDFGTGYSSLAYLKRLPVDEIKIDKSFVMDMQANENDAAIVRSTIDLAHNLGLKVTAEGVESQSVWNTLGMLGCDCSQGYFMARPLPADQLTKWLDESVWARRALANNAAG